MKKAEIHTDKGVMEVEFYEKDAPNTVDNFIKLAKEGFYVGTGGPGYSIDCELDGENQYHDRGVLSMAHAGRNTGGSQFFICLSRENTKHLDRQHTCFGKVVKGIDVIDEIVAGDRINKIEVIEE